MCENCDGFAESEHILDYYNFVNHVRQLDDFLSRHVFVLVDGQDTWQLIHTKVPMPDVASYKFECPFCKSVFELSADFYHGGASWRLLHDKQEAKHLII